MPLDLETRDQLIETVRRFVRENCVPLEAKVAEDDRVPDEIVAEMRELGLFGLSIPDEYGGLGLTMEEEVLVAMELGHTSPAFRSVIGTNVGIGSQGVVMFGTEAQKREWLPKLASGEVVASFALTEPGAGSDAASVAHDGDPRRRSLCRQRHQALHHQRQPRRHVHADGAQRSVDARARAASRPSSCPPTRRASPSASPRRRWASRARISATSIFENARVPARLRLGAEGEGFKVAMQVLDRGRLHISGVCVGVAERLIGEA